MTRQMITLKFKYWIVLIVVLLKITNYSGSNAGNVIETFKSDTISTVFFR